MKNTIPALEKAITVLQCVGMSKGGMSCKELSEESGASATTCYRIVQTLCAFNWLAPVAEGRYDLSTGLLPLANKLSNLENLFQSMELTLKDLANKTGLSCKLSIRQGDTQLAVLRAESPRPIALTGKAGARYSVLEGSSGACLLADLSRTRIEEFLRDADDGVTEKQQPELIWQRLKQLETEGITLAMGDSTSHIYAMSAPVYMGRNADAGAITLVGLKEDFTDERLAEYRELLLAAAGATQAKA